ncbi:hypothetical protein AB7M22_001071 [Pseudomonas sp. ADAK2 TE3594]
MKKGYRTLKGAGAADILEAPVYKANDLENRRFGDFSNSEKL